jgi:hypothetical protein
VTETVVTRIVKIKHDCDTLFIRERRSGTGYIVHANYLKVIPQKGTPPYKLLLPGRILRCHIEDELSQFMLYGANDLLILSLADPAKPKL